MKLDKNHTMVYLDADKQTYADLNVTGNVYGEQALCSLFLKAETKKGKSLMLDWIMHPLSDWEEICKRQEAIAWDFLPELPLNEEELDFIEYYLEYREQIRGANILLSCATIIDRLVRYDPVCGSPGSEIGFSHVAPFGEMDYCRRGEYATTFKRNS